MRCKKKLTNDVSYGLLSGVLQRWQRVFQIISGFGLGILSARFGFQPVDTWRLWWNEPAKAGRLGENDV